MKTQGFGNKQLTVPQAHTVNRIRSWWLLAFPCEAGKVPSQYGRIKEGIVAISEDRKRGETALLLREQDGGGGLSQNIPSDVEPGTGELCKHHRFLKAVSSL